MKSISVLKNKILGMDIGSKRIGLAIWNPENEWIRPLPVLARKTLKEDLKVLDALFKSESISSIVIGMPYSLGEKRTPSTETAIFWMEKLKSTFDLPIYPQDEALSTSEAYKRLQHTSSKRRRQHLDSASAAIILEEFVRERKNLEKL